MDVLTPGVGMVGLRQPCEFWFREEAVLHGPPTRYEFRSLATPAATRGTAPIRLGDGQVVAVHVPDRTEDLDVVLLTAGQAEGERFVVRGGVGTRQQVSLCVVHGEVEVAVRMREGDPDRVGSAPARREGEAIGVG